MTNTSRWDINEHAAINPDAFTAGDWHTVDDTQGAAGRFYVRVGKSPDGQLVITGILMGGEPIPFVGVVLPAITAKTLREIQPAQILKTMQWREKDSPPPRGIGPVDPLTGLARFEGMTERIEAAAREQKGPGRPGPSLAQLREFAAVYLRHREYAGVRAMSHTYREMHISRAKANRWAKQCRELGFIPTGETEND
jgi:hypothetical protein